MIDADMEFVIKLLEDWWNDEGKLEGFPFKITFIDGGMWKVTSNDMFFEKDSILWENLDKYFLKEYIVEENMVHLIIFSAGEFKKDNLICVLPNAYAGRKIPQFFGNEIDPCLMVYRGGRHLLNVFKLIDLLKLDKKIVTVLPE